MLKISTVNLLGKSETPKSINLIIGPNNSGKSTLLGELGIGLSGLSLPSSTKWIESFDLSGSLLKTYTKSLIPTAFSSKNFEDVREIRNAGFSRYSQQLGGDIWSETVYNQLSSIDDSDKSISINRDDNDHTAEWYYWRFVVASAFQIETCENRLQGSFQTTINRLDKPPVEDFIANLFIDKKALQEISSHIKSVFDINIGFDNLVQGQKALRILPSTRISGAANIKSTADEWDRLSPFVGDQGHGIRAYLKIVFSLLDDKTEIVLIDEPETFLHPPQRRALGNLVTKLAKEKGKQVFISSHDPDFLRGVLSARQNDVKVFYLKRDKTDSTFGYQVLDAIDINALISQKSSNLLNERILNSFFYKKTILCEAEDDRVFYEEAGALYHWNQFQEINYVGLSGCGEVLKIFDRLRTLNLNVWAVFDVDFLLNVFPKAINDPALKSKFTAFKNSVTTSEREAFKKEGIKYIQRSKPGQLQNFRDIVAGLKSNHIFIVPIGEFESFTQSKHGDLSHALEIIRKTKKRDLNIFLKELLAIT